MVAAKSFLKPALLPAVLLFCLTSLFAQSNAVEAMWQEQMDTSENSIVKPMYLEVNKDDVEGLLGRQPNFGMYKESYFTTGVATNKKVSRHTADAKFQISIRQRLLNKFMPLHSQLMLIYSQKSFWNIYSESSPFTDNNYNPGILVARPLIRKNKLRGMATFSAEHESNGKSGDESRSWNFFTSSVVYFFNMYFSLQGRAWYGWLDDNNADLFTYRGYGLLVLNYRGFNNRLGVSLLANPCAKGLNTQLELSFNPIKKSNFYIFQQWYQGYGEGLLAYNRYTSMLRVGICLKPPLRDLY